MNQQLFRSADDEGKTNLDDGFAERSAKSNCISKLLPAKQDPTRIKIFVGSKIVATLPITTVSTFGLRCGIPWDKELSSRVLEASTNDKAWQFALKTVNRRALSSSELNQKLITKGYTQGVAQEITNKMIKLSYIDDEAYGRALIRQVTVSKPAGPRLIRQKLITKKLDPELVNRLVAEHKDSTSNSKDDENNVDVKLTKLVQSRLARMANLDINTKKRRLYGLLARRGFYPEQITNALNSLIPNEPDSD